MPSSWFKNINSGDLDDDPDEAFFVKSESQTPSSGGRFVIELRPVLCASTGSACYSAQTLRTLDGLVSAYIVRVVEGALQLQSDSTSSVVSSEHLLRAIVDPVQRARAEEALRVHQELQEDRRCITDTVLEQMAGGAATHG
eukprot:NODE_4427_length_810_cov_26.300920_g4093_i0.p1 GENE.NODE_4427_length_810_cov_26.300920_g4093_i0~~NODE_4427_length_810_cov_26.300920_g4093_i0.p1  ORF type:complete len:141 (+),score=20.42 NODE_4427_length_810_cov_26.300920_g4093_i0:129-551(+)